MSKISEAIIELEAIKGSAGKIQADVFYSLKADQALTLLKEAEAEMDTMARLMLEVADKLKDCPCGYRDQMITRAKQALSAEGEK